LKSNLRETPLYITGEEHVIGEDSNGLVRLEEACQKDSVSIAGFIEVYTEPQTGQFQVKHGTDSIGREVGFYLKFNVLDNDKAITVDYFGMGSVIWAEDWNELNNRIDNAETKTIGPTIDTIISIPEEANGQISPTIKGRTVTNLLGDKGGCENTADFTASFGIANTFELDPTNKIFGDNSIRVGGITSSNFKGFDISLTSGKHYFISGYVKSSDGVVSGRIGIRRAEADYSLTPDSTDTIFKRNGLKYVADGTEEYFGPFSYENGSTGYVNYDGLMIVEITENEYNNLTVDELLQNYSWHNGTKSTVLAIREKAVGKNLFDINSLLLHRINKSSGIELSQNNSLIVTDANSDIGGMVCRIEDFKNYIVTFESNSSINTRAVYYSEKPTYAYDSSDSNYISMETDFVSGHQLTIPSGAKYVVIALYANMVGLEMYNIQLEEGTTATEYEPYKDSKTYILGKDENGNILEMRSLPNGVNDEVKDNQFIQRIYEKEVTSELATSPLTNNDLYKIGSIGLSTIYNDNYYVLKDGVKLQYITYADRDLIESRGKVYGSVSGDIWLIVEKGTTPTYPYSLIYQSKNKIVVEANKPNPYGIDFRVEGSLKAFPGGSIQFDSYYRFPHDTNTTSITLKKPISNIDNIYKLENGTWVGATGTLSATGTTIIGVTAGTYRVEGPIRTEESTEGEKTITVDTNIAARIDSIEDLSMNNADILSEHELMLLTLAVQIIELQGGA